MEAVDPAPSPPLPVPGNPAGPTCLEENNPEMGEGQGLHPPLRAAGKISREPRGHVWRPA